MADKDQGFPDMQNEVTMWTMHCREALARMQKSIDVLDLGQRANKSAIDRIETKVSNGLVHKVDTIERRMWAIAGATILTLVGIIINIALILIPRLV